MPDIEQIQTKIKIKQYQKIFDFYHPTPSQYKSLGVLAKKNVLIGKQSMQLTGMLYV